MFERGVSFAPGAAPAGRAWLNSPVAKTRSPTITWSQTTPLICTVGSAAADTVSTRRVGGRSVGPGRRAAARDAREVRRRHSERDRGHEEPLRAANEQPVYVRRAMPRA